MSGASVSQFLFGYLFFIPDTNIVMTLLHILFVALLINYKEKQLAQH